MPPDLQPAPADELDYRFTLANERTFLAWIRTALALVAGGAAAAKALDVHHELVRWTIAVPPILAGAGLAAAADRRRRAYEAAMLRRGRLSDAGLAVVGSGVAAYALLVLLCLALDG